MFSYEKSTVVNFCITRNSNLTVSNELLFFGHKLNLSISYKTKDVNNKCDSLNKCAKPDSRFERMTRVDPGMELYGFYVVLYGACVCRRVPRLRAHLSFTLRQAHHINFFQLSRLLNVHLIPYAKNQFPSNVSNCKTEGVIMTKTMPSGAEFQVNSWLAGRRIQDVTERN